ncbi:MAG: hypothetical protein EG822_14525 [Deltaproteobacteria bacterium]|nr:hypothetical protein [Deltaproteobacteria bacterium]TLN02186.1 MAG: hypothetical protein FDZ73_13005 [bacterium]
MQIVRWGSERDHGSSSTVFEPPSAKWNHINKVVEMRDTFVPDFNTNANHNWEVSVNLRELHIMIDAVADALHSEMFGEGNAALIAKEMSPSLTSLLRLATICSQYLENK